MSILRRVTLILFGLLFITVITVSLIVPQALYSIADSVGVIATPIRLIIVIAVDVVILLLIYALIRRRRVVNKGGLVVKSRGGNALADVSTESARERVLKVVREVPDVVSAEARLDGIDGKADIDMDVVVYGEQTNVPEKHAEINRALRQVIIKQLGLELANRPRVHIRLQGPNDVIAPPEPVAEPVLPMAPVVPPVILPPPPAPLAPPAPVAPVDDDTPVGDGVVTAMYGLIGRRTAQVKAVPVEPEPAVDAVEPSAPSEPEAAAFTSWYEEPAVADNEEEDEAFYATLRSLPNAEITPPPEPESNPITAELEALDEAAESVEEKGNLVVFNLPSPAVEESTLITEVPRPPVEAAESTSEDSTSAPSSGLYDVNDDREPEFDGDDVAKGSTSI